MRPPGNASVSGVGTAVLLEIRQMDAGYGSRRVLDNIDLAVHEGQVVAIIGPNGAGKSTLLRTILGIVPSWRGDVRFDGIELRRASPGVARSLGIAFVPQGTRVFSRLTVLENIALGGYGLPRRERKLRIAHVLDVFPILGQRQTQRAGTLSGGEQQMVAFGRALVGRPRMLLLDEPSLGLSPQAAASVFERICDMNSLEGVTVVIVEHKVRQVFEIVTRVVALRRGQVLMKGAPSDFNDTELARLFLE